MKTVYRTNQFLYAADTESKPGKMIVDLVQFERMELDLADEIDMELTKFNVLDVNRAEVRTIGKLANEAT